jgi:hypothetical protein
LRRYEWVHVSLGLAGGLSFFIGSICFLSEETQQVGVCMFIFGSFGMLIGNIGDVVVKQKQARIEDDTKPQAQDP